MGMKTPPSATALAEAEALLQELKPTLAEMIERHDPSVQSLKFDDIEAHAAAVGDLLAKLMMVRALERQPGVTPAEKQAAREAAVRRNGGASASQANCRWRIFPSACASSRRCAARLPSRRPPSPYRALHAEGLCGMSAKVLPWQRHESFREASARAPSAAADSIGPNQVIGRGTNTDHRPSRRFPAGPREYRSGHSESRREWRGHGGAGRAGGGRP